MIVTTTNSIPGKKITEILGLASGGDTYIVGGMLGGGVTANGQTLYYDATLKKAVDKMKENAKLYFNATNDDAIVGIQINSASSNGTISITVTGTVVKLEDAGYDEELPDF